MVNNKYSRLGMSCRFSQLFDALKVNEINKMHEIIISKSDVDEFKTVTETRVIK